MCIRDIRSLVMPVQMSVVVSVAIAFTALSVITCRIPHRISTRPESSHICTKLYHRRTAPGSNCGFTAVILKMCRRDRYQVVGIWNSYMDGLLYLSSESRVPLQLVLREILVKNSVDGGQMGMGEDELENLKEQMKYCVIVVSTLPMMILLSLIHI